MYYTRYVSRIKSSCLVRLLDGESCVEVNM